MIMPDVLIIISPYSYQISFLVSVTLMFLLPLRKVILNQSFKVAVSHQDIFLASVSHRYRTAEHRLINNQSIVNCNFVDLKAMIDNPRYTYLY